MGPDYDIVEFENLKSDICVDGDSAISNSRYWQKATTNGEDLSLEFYLTDIWSSEANAGRSKASPQQRGISQQTDSSRVYRDLSESISFGLLWRRCAPRKSRERSEGSD